MRRRLLMIGLAGAFAFLGAGAWAETLVDGEIRKVDTAAGKVTIRHAPLTELDMPAMTMVFRVADPKLLDGLNTGDKVRFVATRDGGVFTVTRLEVVR